MLLGCQVKAQMDEEVQVLQENLGNLRKAIVRLEAAKRAVASFSKRTQGKTPAHGAQGLVQAG